MDGSEKVKTNQYSSTDKFNAASSVWLMGAYLQCPLKINVGIENPPPTISPNAPTPRRTCPYAGTFFECGYCKKEGPRL